MIYACGVEAVEPNRIYTHGIGTYKDLKRKQLQIIQMKPDPTDIHMIRITRRIGYKIGEATS